MELPTDKSHRRTTSIQLLMMKKLRQHIWYTMHNQNRRSFPCKNLARVYIVEGMNQCAGLHALHLAEKEVGKVKHEDYVTFVTSVDKCKFRFPVFPGTRLKFEAKLAKRKMNHMFYDCKVFDSETRVASATVGLTAKKL